MPATPSPTALPVTVDNFVRAESDMYFATLAKEAGLGKLNHRREPASIDNQTVIRLNRDTLYSSGVFDLDAGPVTITLPDSAGRFMALQIISQDHYSWVVYGKGPHRITREEVGTRYVLTGIRTLVDPNDPADVKKVTSLQDAIAVEQNAPGTLELPNWDLASQKKVRELLLGLGATMPDFAGAFGKKSEVEPVRRLIGAALGWGGNPAQDATYLNVTPPRNDGTTVYELVVKDVPVDAFWSVSVYNADGYYEKNPRNSYAINSITGKKGDDGSITIRFGGCTDATPNCIPIVQGWNYTVRLYRPRPEILKGDWKFPAPTPVS